MVTRHLYHSLVPRPNAGHEAKPMRGCSPKVRGGVRNLIDTAHSYKKHQAGVEYMVTKNWKPAG